MNAKDKAKELINKFHKHCEVNHIPLYHTKKCALIAVDEVLKNIDATILYHKESITLPFNKEYWNEVKTEIELY